MAAVDGEDFERVASPEQFRAAMRAAMSRMVGWAPEVIYVSPEQYRELQVYAATDILMSEIEGFLS